MKKLLLLLFLSLSSLLIYSQNITIGKIDSIDSKILKEQRKIWVHVPDSNAEGIAFGKEKYPVVYLLDGDAHFYSVTGMIRQLSAMNGNTLCPKMIVVGIPNTNRTRDLTPTKGTPHPYIDETMIEVSGGGEKFIKFMKKELIPYIESNYPTQPYRMLIGHSFGGITAINALVNHTDLFNSYVSIDPSMWWSDQQLLKEIKAAPNNKKYENVSLFLSIANTLGKDYDFITAQSDTTSMTEHFRTILDLGTHLYSNPSGLNFRYKYYDDDNHGSVPLISEYDALRFIFKDYALKIGMEDFLDTESNVYNRVNDHYKNLSKSFGYTIKPDEQLINQVSYQLMQMEQMDRAGQFFKMNVANYPNSPNVYDSLGDFYVETGNKEKAILNFKKALEIQETPYTRDKLTELEKK